MPARDRNRPEYTAGRLPVSMKGLDEAASEDFVVSVEDRGLAGCHGPLGSPKADAELLVPGRGEKSLSACMPMPDLDHRLLRPGGRGPRNPVHPRYSELRPVPIGLRADDHLPLLGKDLQDIPRLRARETQSLALPYRETVDSLMGS